MKMKPLSPLYLSLYDLWCIETRPLTPLLADRANLSLPQADLARKQALQAITFALLQFHQHQPAPIEQQGEAVQKRLLARSHKLLRHSRYVDAALIQHAHKQGASLLDSLFIEPHLLKQSVQHIASHIAATPKQAYLLLSSLTLIVLSHLDTVVTHGKLNGNEISQWLTLQRRFLTLARSDATDDPLLAHPAIDKQWFALFPQPTSPATPISTDTTSATSSAGLPHYAKVMGHTQQAEQGKAVLSFAPLLSITLPPQRWLLQLAQLTQAHLQQHRFGIGQNTKQPFSMLGDGEQQRQTQTPKAPAQTASERPIEYDAPAPFWQNRVLQFLGLVGLGIMVIALWWQHQQQQAFSEQVAQLEAQRSQDQASDRPQDVAIIRMDEETVTGEESMMGEEGIDTTDSEF